MNAVELVNNATAAGSRRICHVCSGHSVDDVRVYWRECASLAKAGYDVHLIAGSKEADTYVKEGVTLHALPSCESRRDRIRRRKHVARMARDLRPDLFHVHEPELLGSVLAIAGSRPVVYDVHESYLDVLMDRDWIPKLLRPLVRSMWDMYERKLVRRCAAVMPVTDRVANRYLKLHPNITVVANFPNLGYFARFGSARHDRDMCVFTGTILPNRGLSQTISALGLLKRRGLSVRLAMAGMGTAEYIDELLAQAKSEGVGDEVVYKGVLSRSEAITMASEAGIGLVPHLPYGNNLMAWPVKMTEYMALGLPLVYSDFPSHVALAGGLPIGVAVDPNDIEQIADAIACLVTDHRLAEEMGAAAAKHAFSECNWETEKHKLFGVYEKLLT